jgi:hypothetical protein
MVLICMRPDLCVSAEMCVEGDMREAEAERYTGGVNVKRWNANKDVSLSQHHGAQVIPWPVCSASFSRNIINNSSRDVGIE